MINKLKHISFFNAFYSFLCIVYVWILIHYSIAMWETRQRYGIIFLTLTLMVASLLESKRKTFLGLKGTSKSLLAGLFFILALVGGIYFWIEYPSLVYERAGDINSLDALVSVFFIYLVIQLTWATSGATIPLVTIIFISYAMFGHILPKGSFFYHPHISFIRFMELSCAEIDGIFGVLNQIGATWIAIFAFYAGFVQGFGGLDFILRCVYRLVARRKTGVPQIAVLASMGFGGMSGSAAANAVSTGSFTIPTMKRFGLPPAVAASIESVASSGGQIMPPILGAVAFVMCDFLNLYYYQVLFASLFASIIYFGSTMLSVHFIAKRFIDPNKEVDMPAEFKEKMSPGFLLQGLPIGISLFVLLYVFIIYRINILLGGFYTIMSFLICRFVYELFLAKGRPISMLTFFKGVYSGTIRGATTIVSIGPMLGALGIVIRVLTTTGLAEKISYQVVFAFAGNILLLLFFTMIICIIFGMAVTTVAAYILVVTLAAPALLEVGIQPLVAHFAVFYWGMLSAVTPPVAAVCVVTAGIANSNFFKTCWESIKLGIPKFILPFFFISYPEILSLSPQGFTAFLIASIGFMALSAGIQSGWGVWQQVLLIALAVMILTFPTGLYLWISIFITVIVFPILWKTYSGRVRPKVVKDLEGLQEGRA